MKYIVTKENYIQFVATDDSNQITNHFTQSIRLNKSPIDSFCLIGKKIITNNGWYSIDEI